MVWIESFPSLGRIGRSKSGVAYQKSHLFAIDRYLLSKRRFNGCFVEENILTVRRLGGGYFATVVLRSLSLFQVCWSDFPWELKGVWGSSIVDNLIVGEPNYNIFKDDGKKKARSCKYLDTEMDWAQFWPIEQRDSQKLKREQIGQGDSHHASWATQNRCPIVLHLSYKGGRVLSHLEHFERCEQSFTWLGEYPTLPSKGFLPILTFSFQSFFQSALVRGLLRTNCLHAACWFDRKFSRHIRGPYQRVFIGGWVVDWVVK